MRTSPNSRVIISVVLLALIVGGGSYGLASHNANKNKAALRSQISELKSQAINASFIELKPLGVKFPLADNSQQLVYVLGNDGIIYFDSQGLLQLAGYTGCKIGGANLGALSQSTAPLNSVASTTSNGLVAHVGNYYYNYFHPKACSSAKAVVDEQMKQAANLIIGLKDLFND